jgi:hypothetical protein
MDGPSPGPCSGALHDREGYMSLGGQPQPHPNRTFAAAAQHGRIHESSPRIIITGSILLGSQAHIPGS